MSPFAFLASPGARFGLSGTLIAFYAIIDAVARRRGHQDFPAPTPRWVTPLTLVSIGVYYALIGPTGHPLWRGWGNGAGVGLCVIAGAARWTSVLRYPRLAARALFYTGLPLAVGVPWGLLALSAPAVFSSVWVYRRAELLQRRDSRATESASA
jgi:hypothetical protein